MHIEKFLEKSEFSHEERSLKKKGAKNMKRGWEEGNWKICPLPQACSVELETRERREVYSGLVDKSPLSRDCSIVWLSSVRKFTVYICINVAYLLRM